MSLPTDFQKYIHISRYARWLDDKGRRETWEETVRRYFNFWEKRYPWLNELPVWEKIEQAVLNLEVMPSMRALMTAGPALEKDNLAGYNPITGDTRLVTKEYGNIPIEEIAGQEVTVLNKDGNWTSAVINSFGKQRTKEVTLKLNSNTVKKVKCTENHRWILSNGSVKATSELQPKDVINFVSALKSSIDSDYIIGVRHGLVYGDGTAVRSFKRIKGYHIRLCGDSKELLWVFNDYPVSYPPSANGDPIVYLFDDFAATHSLKELPENETDSYTLGFIRGWIAADGSVSKSGQISLCVNSTGLQWLKTNAEKHGFVLQNYTKQPSFTNYGKRTTDSYKVFFSRSSTISEDILCSWKKVNQKDLISHYSVFTVEDTGDIEEVYCAEVPDTNTFVLEGGLVTGNCAAIVADTPRALDETVYALMCGTGLGFSVERQYVSQLPEVANEFHQSDTVIKVKDSKIGWAAAYRELISLLYAGQIPKWDVSKIRPAGARLKTFGGRSSGPKPLEDLFKFTIEVFKKAAGRKLQSIEVHDLFCKIADIVVVGGVRRSALISLSNLTDERMRVAKSGSWWIDNPQRALSNNSVCYTEKPDIGIFMREWLSLYDSKSGERGIFSRDAAKKHLKKHVERRDPNHDWLCNPCSEILLRSAQCCNLTEVVARVFDSFEDLKNKVEYATILGTLQSTLTELRYLRPIWKKNMEEERLLGVSLTGIMDHPVLSRKKDGFDNTWEGISSSDRELVYVQPRPLNVILTDLKNSAVAVNKDWANKLSISPATAITCVKPSGTVSQLVNSSSGIHPRFSRYYIRTVRVDKKDPIYHYMKSVGIPVEDELLHPESTAVFSFPIKSPDSSVLVPDRTAIEQLELWKIYAEHWCEHKPSVTIYVREDEWFDVGAWCYKNFDILSGVSFLPYSGHSYQQAPYQEIDEATYLKAVENMPKEIDWLKLQDWETEDTTSVAPELACSAGICEL